MNIKKIDIIKLTLIFLYILSFYIFGADPQKVKYSEIILILLLGLELIRFFKIEKIKYNILIIILYAFTFFCFLSSFWAINSVLSIEKAKTLFILVSFLWIIYNYFMGIEKGEDKLLKIIMWAGIMFSIYIINYYGIGGYFSKLINGERVGSEINNVNTIGLQVATSFIITIFYAFYDNRKKYFILSIIPLIVALGTGSRKVIALIFIGIILLLSLKKDKKINSSKLVKDIILFILLICALIFVIQIPIFSSAFVRIEGLINGITGHGNVDSSTKLRQLYISAGIEQFLKTPILGIGIGNSNYLTLEVSQNSTYLHNNFVELLATTGIIGFVLYYIVYIYIIINCLKLLKNKNKYINIVLIIFLVNLILDFGTVSYYTKNTYLFFALGMIVIDNIKKEKKNEK